MLQMRTVSLPGNRLQILVLHAEEKKFHALLSRALSSTDRIDPNKVMERLETKHLIEMHRKALAHAAMPYRSQAPNSPYPPLRSLSIYRLYHREQVFHSG